MELTEAAIDAIQDNHAVSLENGNLVVSSEWFEVDAYGAAVAGILGAIKLGLASGSLGQGAEEDTLRRVLAVLRIEDPAIMEEGWMG
jgi:hypothetical protein